MECVHFQNYLAEFNLDSYKLVSAYFSASVNKEARKRKAFSCLCYTCGKTSTIGNLRKILNLSCITRIIVYLYINK